MPATAQVVVKWEQHHRSRASLQTPAAECDAGRVYSCSDLHRELKKKLSLNGSSSSVLYVRSNMCRYLPFFVASLAFVVAVSSQLRSAEASLPASQAFLDHEIQLSSEGIYASQANLRASGRSFRTSLAIVSLLAAVAAMVFLVSQCFRVLESQRTSTGLRVAARRLAGVDDSAEGGDEGCVTFGFFGGVPVGKDPSGTPTKVLVTVEGGKPFLEHPKTGEMVPLIVQRHPDLGLMLHEASTGNDLEWLMYHNPGELKDGAGGEEGKEEEEGKDDSSSSSSDEEGGDDDRPKTARIVYKPTVEEWTHEEHPEFPYTIFISNIPFKIDSETGEIKEVLYTVMHGELAFMHPKFGQPMKLQLIEGDLIGPEGLTPRQIVEEIKQAGPE